MAVDYSLSGINVREDLLAAHESLLDYIRRPGNWWSGSERLAIAAESRRSLACGLCRERKQALSPNAVQGAHDSVSDLSPVALEVVHRVRTDPGRLSRAWFEGIMATGLSDGHYVEIISIVTMMAGMDHFALALGVDSLPLPEPVAGEASRVRPAGAKPGVAWVPMIAPADAVGPEQGLYGKAVMVPNIMRALSLVPDAARALQTSSNAHYAPVESIADPTVHRSIDRLQMELVAARVSALNQCFY